MKKFGEERINHEFNLIKLITAVRNMKLFLKKELMSREYQINKNSDPFEQEVLTKNVKYWIF